MDYILYKDINGKYQTLKELVPEKTEEQPEDNPGEGGL